jgi:hypothetical protein
MEEPNEALYNFIVAMKAKLDENAHKGTTWRDMDPGWLFMRLQGELGELYAELMAKDPDPEKVSRECADVANFCFFISDKVRHEQLSRGGEQLRDGEPEHGQDDA